MPTDNVTYAHIADAKTGGQQHHCQDNGGKAFKAFVTVGMVSVPLLAGDVDPDHDNDCGNHIGCGMDCVRDHGVGMGDDACQELECGQDHVPHNGYNGYVHGDLLV